MTGVQTCALPILVPRVLGSSGGVGSSGVGSSGGVGSSAGFGFLWFWVPRVLGSSGFSYSTLFYKLNQVTAPREEPCSTFWVLELELIWTGLRTLTDRED